jgi:hypothetical protein
MLQIVSDERSAAGFPPKHPIRCDRRSSLHGLHLFRSLTQYSHPFELHHIIKGDDNIKDCLHITYAKDLGFAALSQKQDQGFPHRFIVQYFLQIPLRHGAALWQTCTIEGIFT